MEQYKIVLISLGILFVFILIYCLGRLIIYKKIISLNNKGKKDVKNVNLLYDDYYSNSDNKKFNKLNDNLGIFRKSIYSKKNDCDIELLKIPNKKTNILILSSQNVSFELDLLNKYSNIYITTTFNNLLDAKYAKEEIESLGLRDKIVILYSKPNDFIKELENKKYDRIILRENLGNISDRLLFLKLLKKKNLLKDNDSFILIKTFVFQPIFEKEQLNQEYSKSKSAINNFIFENQKKIIDYWNYNFSTKQSIINDLTESGFKNVYYSKCNICLGLLLSCNFKDIINLLKLYFIEMNMNIDELNVWHIIHTIDILYIKVN